MSKVVDLTGQTFGRLVVQERASGNTSCGGAQWTVRCECGATKVVRSRSLISGDTKSCGCLHRERARRLGQGNRLEVVKYDAVHRRMRLADPASTHQCADCNEPAAEWSYDRKDPNELTDAKGRPFSLDPGRYLARCRSCHRKLDARAAA